MSQENVEIVRAMYESWNRTGGVPALQLEWIDSGIEVDLPRVDTYRGHDGFADALESFWDSFEDHHIEIEECVPTGDDVVLTVHYFGRGKSSGVEVDMRHWHVWTMRDGKAVCWRVFDTRVEALEAAGLSEQDAHADS